VLGVVWTFWATPGIAATRHPLREGFSRRHGSTTDATIGGFAARPRCPESLAQRTVALLVGGRPAGLGGKSLRLVSASASTARRQAGIAEIASVVGCAADFEQREVAYYGPFRTDGDGRPL
jgi:hypothetical protein